MFAIEIARIRQQNNESILYNLIQVKHTLQVFKSIYMKIGILYCTRDECRVVSEYFKLTKTMDSVVRVYYIIFYERAGNYFLDILNIVQTISPILSLLFVAR